MDYRSLGLAAPRLRSFTRRGLVMSVAGFATFAASIALGACSGTTAQGLGGSVIDDASDASDASGGADAGDDALADSSPVETTFPDGPSFDSNLGDAVLGDAVETVCGVCPAGSTCSTFNGVPACRTESGVPVFSHVFVVMMENTSLATLSAAKNTPNIDNIRSKYASGANYKGAHVHPSLPNYIALTSGDDQGVGCDCKPDPTAGDCGALLACTLLTGNCGCNKAVDNLGDQLEKAGKSWMSLAEGMGTSCNLTDVGKYAVRHVPFLYYDSIRNSPSRCNAHVQPLTALKTGADAPNFQFISPDLDHDMHDPVLGAGATNTKNGDDFLGAFVAKILAGDAYKRGGLLVVVWDEDDGSGGITGADDRIPIFVLSPLAKSGAFVSAVAADHYNLLATIEDGLALPRLGKATGVKPLADYFSTK